MERLPIEILSTIIEYMSLQTAVRFSMTSKYYNDLMYHVSYYFNKVDTYKSSILLDSLRFKYPRLSSILDIYMRYGTFTDTISDIFTGGGRYNKREICHRNIISYEYLMS